jgi:Raf kinase inhibitor-like YbhB/YbcL family protein
MTDPAASTSRSIHRWAVVVLLLLPAMIGCASTGQGIQTSPPSGATPIPSSSPSTSPEETAMATARFTLTSSAFSEGGTIPRRYTCDGEDVSPPLRWSGAPDGTAAFALIVDDPDASGFVHWVAADIPANTSELPEGARGSQAGDQGRNDFRRTGYGGPCPPRGRPHRYVFRLLALSKKLNLQGTPTADDVRRAARAVTLGEATLTASYTRAG